MCVCVYVYSEESDVCCGNEKSTNFTEYSKNNTYNERQHMNDLY